MRIIVLGSKGQLGSEVVKQLRTSKYEVMGLTRQELDATDPNVRLRLEDLPRHDVIVNCMAYVKVDDAEDRPVELDKTNVSFPAALAEFCARHDKTLIHISTDFVFDGAAGKAYTEGAATSPINEYGRSKRDGETLVRDHLQEHYIVRVAGLYGPNGSGSKGGNFVESILKRARENGGVKVVNDITTSTTSAVDAAEAISALISEAPSYGTYHCVNSGSCTWFDFAKEILRLCQSDAAIQAIESADLKLRAKRPRFSALADTKLRSLYEMPNWQTALRSYLESKGHIND